MSVEVSLLDYGAGNIRSIRNAILSLGYRVKDIANAEDVAAARLIVFPGVGNFGQAMQSLDSKTLREPLVAYLRSNRPFLGICIGMQSLFEGSEESPEERGLGVVPGVITKFDTSLGVKVPQIGWNGVAPVATTPILDGISLDQKVYFVHSYCALPSDRNLDWVMATTDYGQRYISMVQRGNIVATQFHPEKSGAVGLKIIDAFLSRGGLMDTAGLLKTAVSLQDLTALPRTELAKRVIACLDVRTNDDGDLVVTKGDQYDVREAPSDQSLKGTVRNLGKPVALCKRYYDEGADEVAFLNITSFREGVLEDTPMLAVLTAASENVFVPLTVGGGIREYTEPNGKTWSALDVAAQYFRAGADKVSIGSDAVYAAEEFIASKKKTGLTSIELISSGRHYGAQAVVVSVDPKRVYVSDPSSVSQTGKTVVKLRDSKGPNGEEYCWWQVTVKGGRETRDLDAVQLAKASESLGAGEIMLNCIDMDGQGKGYDLDLISAVQSAVTIPVIASSGAGTVDHFSQVFKETGVMAALAAGIFHRNEVQIQDVKKHMHHSGIPVRI